MILRELWVTIITYETVPSEGKIIKHLATELTIQTLELLTFSGSWNIFLAGMRLLIVLHFLICLCVIQHSGESESLG